ncbi:hypothetical protein PMAYCL1PPCAC_32168, partial [Pristionchus mayeri]
LLYVRDNGGVKANLDELWSYVKGVTSDVYGLCEEAREAYASGTINDWVKQKMNVFFEKMRILLESYPRVQAIVHYVELFLRFGFLFKIPDVNLPKVFIGDQMTTGSTIQSPDNIINTGTSSITDSPKSATTIFQKKCLLSIGGRTRRDQWTNVLGDRDSREDGHRREGIREKD